MSEHQTLKLGEYVSYGNEIVLLQNDGNLVVKSDGQVYWHCKERSYKVSIVTKLGDLFDFGQVFKAFGNN